MRSHTSSRSIDVALALVIALACIAPLGCSFSASSESSSDSSESSSASSASSSPQSKEKAYRDDVRDYTAAWVKSGGGIDDFKRKLGDLAAARGITNWEDNMATYEGIGQGLGKAGVSQVELDAYVQNLSGGNADKAAAIRRGYASTKQ